MDPVQQKVTLESLDLFQLLRLGRLSDGEKQSYMERVASLAMADLLSNGLSDILSPEDQEELIKLAESGDQEKMLALLREKVPDFDNLFQEKILSAKKKLVRANLEEEMKLCVSEREKFRQSQDPEVEKKILQNEQMRTKLEKIIAAIDADDWATASSMITAL